MRLVCVVVWRVWSYERCILYWWEYLFSLELICHRCHLIKNLSSHNMGLLFSAETVSDIFIPKSYLPRTKRNTENLHKFNNSYRCSHRNMAILLCICVFCVDMIKLFQTIDDLFFICYLLL